MSMLTTKAGKLLGLLLCFGFFFGIGCRSEERTTPPDAETADTSFEARPYVYHQDTLENGMRVITLEDRSTPIAAVQRSGPRSAHRSWSSRSSWPSRAQTYVMQRFCELPGTPVPIWLVTHRELRTSRRVRVVYDILAAALEAPTG